MEIVRLEYLGRCPRTFELPIPFTARSAKVGAVVCDPVGEFPREDAERLLALAPGAFRRVDLKPCEEGEDGASEAQSAPPAGPPRERLLTAGALLDLTERLRHRVFKNKGIAVAQRNRYFPGADLRKRGDGQWEIVERPSSALNAERPEAGHLAEAKANEVKDG